LLSEDTAMTQQGLNPQRHCLLDHQSPPQVTWIKDERNQSGDTELLMIQYLSHDSTTVSVLMSKERATGLFKRLREALRQRL
jgi:hypothetical protein